MVGELLMKLLACGVRGLGFQSRSRLLNFIDWVSPTSSLNMTERLLKRHTIRSSILPNQAQIPDHPLTVPPQDWIPL